MWLVSHNLGKMESLLCVYVPYSLTNWIVKHDRHESTVSASQLRFLWQNPFKSSKHFVNADMLNNCNFLKSSKKSHSEEKKQSCLMHQVLPVIILYLNWY